MKISTRLQLFVVLLPVLVLGGCLGEDDGGDSSGDLDQSADTEEITETDEGAEISTESEAPENSAGDLDDESFADAEETTGEQEEIQENTSPAGHSENMNGVFHKLGKDDPLDNCTSCHGAKLDGGVLSCYTCHNNDDHTRSHHGVLHRSGTSNTCNACHGPNNSGGLGPACSKCH